MDIYVLSCEFVSQVCWSLAKISSAEAVHTNGLGSWFCRSRYSLVAASSAATLRNTPQLSLRQGPEEPLYQVQPRAARRREVQHVARVTQQPLLHGRRLVSAVVVPDQVEAPFFLRDGRVDASQQLEELLVPVLPIALADHPPRRHVQCG